MTTLNNFCLLAFVVAALVVLGGALLPPHASLPILGGYGTLHLSALALAKYRGRHGR